MKRKKIFVTDAFGRSRDPRLDEPKAQNNRKNAYERYFSGYEVCEVPKKYGEGTKRVRVYTGDVFRQDLPEGRCKQLRLIYLLLGLGSAGSFAGSLFLNAASNYSVYILFSVLIPVICFMWLGSALLAYIPSGRDLKDYEYREGALRLVSACRITCGGIGLVLVATLVVFVLQPGSFSAKELLRIGMMAVAAACLLVMAWLESHIKYTKIEGKNQAKEKQASESAIFTKREEG